MQEQRLKARQITVFAKPADRGRRGGGARSGVRRSPRLSRDGGKKKADGGKRGGDAPRKRLFQPEPVLVLETPRAARGGSQTSKRLRKARGPAATEDAPFVAESPVSGRHPATSVRQSPRLLHRPGQAVAQDHAADEVIPGTPRRGPKRTLNL